ncbi:hypothetical protein ACFVIM_01840 [Streptomyces sp. NPDC057638]|uniref:hypothetical protein n=1 Tax=Streptomyces sp. NPDC057638 TaxID=3346190 RepID=UPI0036CC8541
MTVMTGPVWSLPLAWGRVEVPASIGGVRARLDEGRAAAFDAEIARTPAVDLVYAVLAWTLPARAATEDPATVARLKAGDFTGVRDGDGDPVTPTHPPHDATSGTPRSSVFRTGFPVGSVTHPATIEGIRAVLDGERLAAFETETAQAPAQDLVYVALRWGYPPEARAEDDRAIEQVKAELAAGITRPAHPPVEEA